MDLVPYTLIRCLYFRARYVPSEHVDFCVEREFHRCIWRDVIPHLRTCLPSEHAVFVSVRLSFVRNTNFIISRHMTPCRRVTFPSFTAGRCRSIQQSMQCGPSFSLLHKAAELLDSLCVLWATCCIIPYPTAFPYGNGMVLHFYQQQESSTTKTVHKVINRGLKTYV